MKKYLKELVILILQLLLFYVFPLTVGPAGAIGMVLLIICGTFILSLILGIISENRVKFLYPVVTAVIFIPSVFIYYNASALIHAVWYLVISGAGILIGAFFRWIGKLLQK